VNRMLDRGERGLVAFTSSSASFLPNPLASIYASSKAFLTAFAASIAAELRPLGIDVAVVHPSPIASRFLENAAGFGAAEASAAVAAPPAVVADALFRTAGRVLLYDQVCIYFHAARGPAAVLCMRACVTSMMCIRALMIRGGVSVCVSSLCVCAMCLCVPVRGV
jgi:hypothetical protein